MAFIDSTVVNVALPALQRDLGATAAQAQWVIEAYALLLASLLLVGGALGDRFGRRRVFSLGLAIFTAGSLGAALATSSGFLITALLVQEADRWLPFFCTKPQATPQEILEAMAQALLMKSEDHAEFYEAFRSGRDPKWSGR